MNGPLSKSGIAERLSVVRIHPPPPGFERNAKCIPRDLPGANRIHPPPPIFMFDTIISFLTITQRFEKYIKKTENVNDILNGTQKRFVFRKKSNTLKVILPPWGNSEYYITRLLINRLIKKGFSCLSYSFPQELLSANAEVTESKFNAIREKVLADIEDLKRQYGFEEIDLIGVSLGGVSACMIANNSNYFKDLFLIVPGNNLAASLWDGIRTQRLKNSFQNQLLEKPDLMKKWHNLAPANNVYNLNLKNIYVVVSKSDRIIPYDYGKKLSEELKRKYKNVTIKENCCLGHYLTVIKYFLFSDLLYK